MSATEPESDGKQELNDSGCVQDESLPKECQPKDSPPKPEVMENGYVGQAQLLDLSDDVLLYILKYCSPHDLKALGFTCARLGALVLERSLWVNVDARDVSTSRARMRWLLGALHEGTRNLLLTGYAEEARGCRGHVNRTRKEVEDEHTMHNVRRDEFLCGRRGIDFDGRYYAAQSTIREVDAPVEIENPNGPGGPEPPFPLIRQHARLHINAQQLPRQSSSPSWPEECEWETPDVEAQESSEDTAGCPGPVFTLSAQMIKEIRMRCPKLTELSLQRCNINCNKISPSIFPPTLKRLSLRGTRCYNPPLDKSYLFRIHDYLPLLEHLELSECAWLEPAALLPLSKLLNLEVLLMRDCPAMAEFVAYVSLATRYGFRALKVLDLRGSPVGDSEVSALGWLPELQELYLEAPNIPDAPSSPLPHHHYIGDPLPRLPHMDQWELQIPDYYKSSSWSESESAESSMEDVEGQIEMLRETYDHPTAPFSIELHTRVIQAAPQAFAHINHQHQQHVQHVQHVPQLNKGEGIHQATAQLNGTLQLNEGEEQDEDGEEERERDRAQVNEKGRGVRRNNDDQSEDEAGPSKRSKQNEHFNEENGKCVKVKEENDAENKTAFKYKIFKHKNVANNNTAGPSNDKQNNLVKPGPSIKKQTIEELSRPCEDSESILGDAGHCNVKTNDAPTNYENEYKTYKHNLQINDGAGPSQSKTKSHENIIDAKSKCRDSEKDDSQINIDTNDRPSTSGYFVRDRRNSDGEPSAKKSRRNSRKDEDSNNKGEKSKTEKPSAVKIDLEHQKENRLQEDEFPVENEKGKKDANLKGKTEKASHKEQERMNKALDQRINKPDGSQETPEDLSRRERTGEIPVEEEQERIEDERQEEEEHRDERVDDEPQAERRQEINIEVQQPAQFVRFRRHQEPVIIQCPVYRNELRPNQPPPLNHNQNPPAQENPNPTAAGAEPRHHVLYVNLGQQLHAVYRLLPHRPSRQHWAPRQPPPDHLDNSFLVSDASIRRFGRADGEDVNIVHIGPNGPQYGGRDTSGRPNRSNLRILSAVGYRHITNRSLVHLATAAPHLTSLDFSRTSVTSDGIDTFKTLRPEVQVKYSTFSERDDDEH